MASQDITNSTFTKEEVAAVEKVLGKNIKLTTNCVTAPIRQIKNISFPSTIKQLPSHGKIIELGSSHFFVICEMASMTDRINIYITKLNDSGILIQILEIVSKE